MRLPLASNLTTRDGTLTKDAKIVNGFVESRGEEAGVFKRPGLYNAGSVGSGLSQLLAVWDGQVRSVVGDTLASFIVYNFLGSTSSERVSGFGEGFTGALIDISSGSYGFVNCIAPAYLQKIFVTEDGATYVERSIPNTSVGTGNANYGMLACNDQLVSYIAYTYLATFYSDINVSSDGGQTWINKGTLPTGTYTVYSNGATLYAYTLVTGTYTTWSSTDLGDTWGSLGVTVAPPSSATNKTEIFIYGATKYIFPDNGVLMYSTDYISWSNSILDVSNFSAVELVDSYIYGLTPDSVSGGLAFYWTRINLPGMTFDPFETYMFTGYF